jgi:hypothetical protein
MMAAEPYLLRVAGHSKIVVGWWGDALARYASITHAIIDTSPVNGGELRRKTYLCPLKMTMRRGITGFGARKKELLGNSKAVFIGGDRTDDLINHLYNLKEQNNMIEILYLFLNDDGEIIDHAYVDGEKPQSSERADQKSADAN